MSRTGVQSSLAATAAAAALALLVGSGCSMSPTTACKEAAKITCQRVYECFTSQERQSQPFIAAFGASETECNTKLNSNNCSSVTDDKPCTDSTKKYYPDKAEACINDVKTSSCETIRQGTVPMGNCDAVCM